MHQPGEERGDDQREQRVVRQPRQHQRGHLAVAHRRRGGGDQPRAPAGSARSRSASARPAPTRGRSAQPREHDAGERAGAASARRGRRDSACTASVVPRSAPSISASAAGSAIRPRATKPVTQHRRGRRALQRRRRRRRRSRPPGAGRRRRGRWRRGARRRSPCRIAACTMWVPQSSRATPPIRFSRMVWPAIASAFSVAARLASKRLTDYESVNGCNAGAAATA